MSLHGAYQWDVAKYANGTHSFFDMIYSNLIVFLEKKVKKSVRRFGDNKICCTFALPFRDPRV